MKTYVLTVSRVFSAKHKRKGEPTYFVEKIGRGLGLNEVQVHEEFGQDILKLYNIDRKFATTIDKVARNDGLSFEDFKEWFKGYDLSNPMALIQFTGFRY